MADQTPNKEPVSSFGRPQSLIWENYYFQETKTLAATGVIGTVSFFLISPLSNPIIGTIGAVFKKYTDQLIDYIYKALSERRTDEKFLKGIKNITYFAKPFVAGGSIWGILKLLNFALPTLSWVTPIGIVPCLIFAVINNSELNKSILESLKELVTDGKKLFAITSVILLIIMKFLFFSASWPILIVLALTWTFSISLIIGLIEKIEQIIKSFTKIDDNKNPAPFAIACICSALLLSLNFWLVTRAIHLKFSPSFNPTILRTLLSPLLPIGILLSLICFVIFSIWINSDWIKWT